MCGESPVGSHVPALSRKCTPPIEKDDLKATLPSFGTKVRILSSMKRFAYFMSIRGLVQVHALPFPPCVFFFYKKKGEIGFFDYYSTLYFCISIWRLDQAQTSPFLNSFTLVIPLAKKLKECGVFGVSSDEYLQYAEANRKEWEIKGESVVKEYIEKYGQMFAQEDETGGEGDNWKRKDIDLPDHDNEVDVNEVDVNEEVQTAAADAHEVAKQQHAMEKAPSE